MKIKMKNNGSIMIVVVFAIALMTALVAGILQLNTEQIRIMKNEVFAAQALAIADAGLADAFSELRSNPNWSTGFSNKSFGGGKYTVTVTGSSPDPNITSTGTSPQGFVARLKAEITIGRIIGSTSSYVIRVDKLKVNE
jgi:Tfp pilus assembly protein PilX